MRHILLMNYMLAVHHWLLKDSTNVSLVYNSSKGWGFFTIKAVICIDENYKLKYSLAGRSMYCECMSGRIILLQFCLYCTDCCLFFLRSRLISYHCIQCPRTRKEGNMLMHTKQMNSILEMVQPAGS